ERAIAARRAVAPRCRVAGRRVGQDRARAALERTGVAQPIGRAAGQTARARRAVGAAHRTRQARGPVAADQDAPHRAPAHGCAVRRPARALLHHGHVPRMRFPPTRAPRALYYARAWQGFPATGREGRGTPALGPTTLARRRSTNLRSRW